MQISSSLSLNKTLAQQAAATSHRPASDTSPFARQLSEEKAHIASTSTSFTPSQPNEPDTYSNDSTAKKSTASENFQAWMNKSVAEKVRQAILHKLGITEEQLAAMDPEERQKIEEQIAEEVAQEIKRQAEEKKRQAEEKTFFPTDEPAQPRHPLIG